MAERIYLDHAATAPVLPAVADRMRELLADSFGNPSSLHAEGRKARQAVDEAREIVSSSLGCEFAEVAFSSGGTEAANLAILGLALAHRGGERDRVLMSAAEHHCVLQTEPLLTAFGYRVEQIPVDREARVDLQQFEDLLSEDVLLVSVMHANNELGSINPINEIAELCAAHGAVLHTDAVQTFLGTDLPWKVADLGADLVSVSAHKIHGPKGVGALYVRPGTKLSPLISGGAQERELRGGTENLVGIAGFGEAVRQLAGGSHSCQREAADTFRAAIETLGAISSVSRNTPTLPGHVHVRFPEIDAETMLIVLDRLGVSAGSGAACSSGSLEPSHVLVACGFTPSQARKGVRFTFGRFSCIQEAEEAAARVAAALRGIEERKS